MNTRSGQTPELDSRYSSHRFGRIQRLSRSWMTPVWRWWTPDCPAVARRFCANRHVGAATRGDHAHHPHPSASRPYWRRGGPMVAASGAEVWAHPLDTPAIEGTGKRDTPKGPLGLVFNMFIIPRLRSVKVTHPLSDGETLPILASEGGLRVVATPGHTFGHISLYLAARKLLFAGDVLRHSGEKIVPSPAMFNRDQAQALRQLRRPDAAGDRGEPAWPWRADHARRWRAAGASGGSAD